MVNNYLGRLNEREKSLLGMLGYSLIFYDGLQGGHFSNFIVNSSEIITAGIKWGLENFDSLSHKIQGIQKDYVPFMDELRYIKELTGEKEVTKGLFGITEAIFGIIGIRKQEKNYHKEIDFEKRLKKVKF
ncbi:MAG: hypothetical protein ABIH28_02015 [archaeon]